MDEKIINIWFSNNRIYVQTDKNKVLDRPLEAFPLLKDASDQERQHFEIGLYGDDVHWRDIDEDICIDSFFEKQEPDYNNDTAKLLKQYPKADIMEVANAVGINKTLMQKYIYGIKQPSKTRFDKIASVLSNLA